MQLLRLGQCVRSFLLSVCR